MNYTDLYPNLSQLFTEKECKVACSYVPEANTNGIDSTNYIDLKHVWVEDVINSDEPEPICPFCGMMECNEAYTWKCHNCPIAEEMWWYKYYNQQNK